MADAFNRAWDLVKMPVYHGTGEKNLRSIMEHGLLPTEKAPQFLDHTYDEVKEMLGYDDDKMNQYFGGDWSFYYGDKAKTMGEDGEMGDWVGGRAGAIRDAYDWASGMEGYENPVVLEIDDQHPDSPFFMPEPRLDPDTQAFNEHKDQRRARGVVLPHLIRRLPQEEVDEALKVQDDYRQAQYDRDNLFREFELHLIDRIQRGL